MRPDPLYRNVVFHERTTIPVLGVPVEFATNDATVLAAVEDNFGMWRRLDRHPAFVSGNEISVRLILHEGDERGDGRVAVSYRMPDAERVLVHTPGSLGVADIRRGEAIVYVTSSLLEDCDHFRNAVLDALTLTLVTTRDRLPVHAAMVRRGDKALILAGPSGVGKSSLAYTAVDSGWELLTDDACYVQLDPEFRLWGNPGRTYLPADTAAKFPALSGREPERLANGKLKIPVDLERQPAAALPPVVTDVVICLLSRAHGPVGLGRATPEELASALSDELGVAHDLYDTTKKLALERLTANGGWRLTLSADPQEALLHLEQMAAE